MGLGEEGRYRAQWPSLIPPLQLRHLLQTAQAETAPRLHWRLLLPLLGAGLLLLHCHLRRPCGLLAPSVPIGPPWVPARQRNRLQSVRQGCLCGEEERRNLNGAVKDQKQANYAERLSHTLVDRDTLKLAKLPSRAGLWRGRGLVK